MAPTTIAAGTTSTFYFQLLNEGVPIDLTDFTVTLLLAGSDGVAISPAGTLTVLAGSNGVVSYAPAVVDISTALSPFKVRWVLTEDTGIVSYIPNAYRDEWDVTLA